MTPPLRPTASLAPVCSGCPCVLISVWMRLARVTSRTAASRASALAARPPSIINAPSGPGIAITLHPAPWSNVAPPRSMVEMRADAWRAIAGWEGSRTPPSAAAPAWRKRRRDRESAGWQKGRPEGRPPPSVGLRCTRSRRLVDRLMNSRLTQREDVRPDALGRAQDRPLRASSHQPGGAQLPEKRRLLLERWSLQRHEGHEAPGLRVVQRREAVLVHGVHVDAERGELPDDLFEALADRVVQRRPAAYL